MTEVTRAVGTGGPAAAAAHDRRALRRRPVRVPTCGMPSVAVPIALHCPTAPPEGCNCSVHFGEHLLYQEQ